MMKDKREDNTHGRDSATSGEGEDEDAESRVVSLTDFIDQLERRAFIRSLDGRRSESWEALKAELLPDGQA